MASPRMQRGEGIVGEGLNREARQSAFQSVVQHRGHVIPEKVEGLLGTQLCAVFPSVSLHPPVVPPSAPMPLWTPRADAYRRFLGD